MPAIQRAKVVLVDDNELTRAALRLMISGDEFEIVAEAANGRSAVETALRLRPDIVCLDVIMPDMSGLDVLHSIKDALPNTAVLMVTASNDLDTIKRALAGGACGYIVKPFTLGTVHDSLMKAAALVRKVPA